MEWANDSIGRCPSVNCVRQVDIPTIAAAHFVNNVHKDWPQRRGGSVALRSVFRGQFIEDNSTKVVFHVMGAIIRIKKDKQHASLAVLEHTKTRRDSQSVFRVQRDHIATW